ncbi:MAG UNVERIFIED_CONTAM: FHA domain-containing protein [Planctomycetaceae bacterium]|jgi:pSer/pThr/pTyr-binding forkhead associated (FHA) protein
MTALLHQLGGGRQIPVDRAVVLVGRSAECDVVLDSSTKISRIHCALVQVDSDYYLRDLGSMNGVWVAGQKVVRQQRLQNGMEVCIGDVRFLFLENVTVAPAPIVAAPPTKQTPPAELELTVNENPQPTAMPRIAVDNDDHTLLETAAALQNQPIDEIIEMEVDVEVIEDP